MKSFDAKRAQEMLLSDVGFEWQLSRSFENSKAAGGLGSSADADLGMAIECILVGFNDPARRLLEKAIHWVESAIAANERPQSYFPSGSEAAWFHTLALCNWLLNDEHDERSFQLFVEHEDRYLANSPAGNDSVSVSFVLPGYINAHAFDRALEIFRSTPGLSVPSTISSIRNEAQMCYFVAKNKLESSVGTKTDVAISANRFLARNMNNWLGNGHWVRAAEWSKIIYWNESEGTLSAKDALLKCYSHCAVSQNLGSQHGLKVRSTED